MAQRNETDESPALFPDNSPASPSPAATSSAWITAYCDGGSRGNPGPSGFGVFIQDENGKPVAELSEYLGKQTNNYAEYSGLLASLNFAIEKGHSRLRVVSDSELMVKQIKGQYRVNSPDLKPLYDEAKRRIARLEMFRIEHVLRGKNQQADRLANLAMDRGMGRSSEPPACPSASPLPGRALDFRAAVKAASGAASAAPAAKLSNPSPKSLKGLVKGGVVHLLGGELPEGIFVMVTPEGK
jgi:probable phosphoglycerate mutase